MAQEQNDEMRSKPSNQLNANVDKNITEIKSMVQNLVAGTDLRDKGAIAEMTKLIP